MIEEIKRELLRLEAENSIKILYAVESGSRAWGFASTDSDWDVRFIYIHKLEWYLQIEDKKDSLDKILPNDIDLAGWEIRKALKLFRKSNPPMMEWLRSPIVYSENLSTAERLRNLSNVYFSPKSCLHHYFHMAEGNYREYLQSDLVRVKKYFYVLRPILACDWIKQTNNMPPMEFEKLLETQLPNEEVKYKILELLQRKKSGQELSVEPKIKILNEFLDEKINFYKEYLKETDTTEAPNTSLLNELFMSTLNEAWIK
jgi:predicted nucleotidyltransferase